MTSAGLDFDEDEDFGLADQGRVNSGNTAAVQAASHKQASLPHQSQGGQAKATAADDFAFEDDPITAHDEEVGIPGSAVMAVESHLTSQEAEEDVEGDEGHVYIGDLQWWTTDADLEQECSRFGRTRDIKFFEDASNGKSKGAAKVVFAKQEAAAACQAALNGHIFHGKRCVVTLPTVHTGQDPVRPISPAPRASSQQLQGQGNQRGQHERPFARPPGGNVWQYGAGPMPPMPGPLPMGMPMMPGAMPQMLGGLGMGSGLPMGFMPPGFLPPGMPFPPQGQWPCGSSSYHDGGGGHKRSRY